MDSLQQIFPMLKWTTHLTFFINQVIPTLRGHNLAGCCSHQFRLSDQAYRTQNRRYHIGSRNTLFTSHMVISSFITAFNNYNLSQKWLGYNNMYCRQNSQFVKVKGGIKSMGNYVMRPLQGCSSNQHAGFKDVCHRICVSSYIKFYPSYVNRSKF